MSSAAIGQTPTGGAKEVKGWLRKRPRIAGYWQNRFVVLSPDAKLTIYSQDPSRVSSANTVITALSTVHIPKTIVVAQPVEKMVRITRGGTKTQKVFAIRVRFKDVVLFTFGAETKEDALRWKTALEHASQAPEAVEELFDPDEFHDARSAPTPKHATPKNNNNRQSVLPEGWNKGEGDSHWQTLELAEGGIHVEGEKQQSHDYPMLRARATVKLPPAEVFKLILDDSKRPLGDNANGGAGVTSKVLREINEQSAIVYMQCSNIWVGPVSTDPRDLCCLRYFRKEEDSSGFVVTWQSVEDAVLAPPAPGFVRGRIFSMGIGVTQKDDGKISTLKIFCHADPGGNLSYTPGLIMQKWLSSFVVRILGIHKVLDDSSVHGGGGGSGGAAASERQMVMDVLDDDSKDLAEDDAELNKTARAPPDLVRQPSLGTSEVNKLKLGTWRHDTWTETPVDEMFRIRGKTYLTDGIKYMTGRHMFHVVAADLNRTDAPVPHCAARSDSPLRQIQAAYPDRQVLVMQFIMPGPPFYLLSFYSVSKPGVCDADTPFSRLWNDFVEGSDEYRNTVFKMIPRVTKGAYVVRKTVGEVPAVLGQKIKLNYYQGPNYLEVDVDLNTSAVAGSILSIFKGYATTLTADLALLLEGHSEDELPEEIMCSFRMMKPELGKAEKLGPDPNPAETKRMMDLVSKGRTGETKRNGEKMS